MRDHHQAVADTKAAHRMRAQQLLEAIDWRVNLAPSDATMALCMAQAATAHAVLATTAPLDVNIPNRAPNYTPPPRYPDLKAGDFIPNEYRPDC